MNDHDKTVARLGTRISELEAERTQLVGDIATVAATNEAIKAAALGWKTRAENAERLLKTTKIELGAYREKFLELRERLRSGANNSKT